MQYVAGVDEAQIVDGIRTIWRTLAAERDASELTLSD
jgi:hypothetical protein